MQKAVPQFLLRMRKKNKNNFRSGTWLHDLRKNSSRQFKIALTNEFVVLNHDIFLYKHSIKTWLPEEAVLTTPGLNYTASYIKEIM